MFGHDGETSTLRVAAEATVSGLILWKGGLELAVNAAHVNPILGGGIMLTVLLGPHFGVEAMRSWWDRSEKNKGYQKPL